MTETLVENKTGRCHCGTFKKKEAPRCKKCETQADFELAKTNPTAFLIKRAEHPFKLLTDSFGCEVPIDEEIADLLEEIWKTGLDTINSCQANPDEKWIWIQFATAGDAVRFLEIVNTNYKEDATSKDVYTRSNQGIWCNPLDWVYDVFVFNQDMDSEEDEDDQIQGHEFRIAEPDFYVSIRFPKSDYAYVLKKIKQNYADLQISRGF